MGSAFAQLVQRNAEFVVFMGVGNRRGAGKADLPVAVVVLGDAKFLPALIGHDPHRGPVQVAVDGIVDGEIERAIEVLAVAPGVAVDGGRGVAGTRAADRKLTAAVDVYLAGLPIVVMLDETELNFSPLRGATGVCFVSTPEELAEALYSQQCKVVDMPDSNEFFFLDPKLPRWSHLLVN